MKPTFVAHETRWQRLGRQEPKRRSQKALALPAFPRWQRTPSNYCSQNFDNKKGERRSFTFFSFFWRSGIFTGGVNGIPTRNSQLYKQLNYHFRLFPQSAEHSLRNFSFKL